MTLRGTTRFPSKIARALAARTTLRIGMAAAALLALLFARTPALEAASSGAAGVSVAAIVSSDAAGSPASGSPAPKPHRSRASGEAAPPLVLTRAEAAPAIDGKLDDAIWSSALKFDAFKTMKPDYGKDPSQRTEAYFAYDADNFYFAAHCYDTDPGKIKAAISKRDLIFQDDVLLLIIDPFNDNQTGYSFAVNPLGIQGDGLLNVQGNLDDTYDMVWYSKGVIDDQGWTVEARIPLQSIRFPNKKTVTMKLFFVRFFTRTSEQATFPALDPSNSSLMPQAQAVDVSGLHFKRVMEFLPAATFADRREAQEGRLVKTERTNFWDMYSFTGKVGLTSDLIADGAWNPDFSQVESDAGQVDINLRYPNYYSEKRPFFLEGQDLWQFGGAMEDAPLQSVVYTRTIADPDYGFRLTGKVSRNDTIAALYARDSLAGEVPGVVTHPGVAVARYKHTLGGDSFLGGFYTDRASSGRLNRVGGFDGRVRLGQPSFVSFHLFGSWTRAESGAAMDKDHALSLNYNYQKRNIYLDLGYQDISPNFQVDTGFLMRTGVRRIAVFVMPMIYPKSSFFQKIDVLYWSQHIYDTTYNMWETFNLFTGRFYLPRSTQIRFDGILANEVFAGQRFGRSGFGFQLQSQVVKQLYIQFFGRWTGRINYDPEDAYQGYGSIMQAALQYQPHEKLDFTLSLVYENFYRSSDHTKVYDYPILRLRNTFQLNKYLFVRAIPEYNMYRKRLTVDTLVSFTYIPGTVFYVGYGSAFERLQWDAVQHAYIDAARFSETKRAFFFKVSYLYRF